MQTIATFLMFEGQAEAAVNLYCSIFPGSEIKSMIRQENGMVQHCSFQLGGQQFMAIDSAVQHAFTFTAATSIFVVCDTEAEVDQFFEALSEGGKVLMPLGTYPFSKRYAWLTDKYGVAWQLSYKLS